MADKQIYDCVCIGFGPAGLAISIAADEQSNFSFLALEQQEDFRWHPGMLIPGAKMQISFVKDLATMRDPKSEFTFLNYLFEHDRLLKFLNLDTFLPAREEYQDYMHWAAQKIQRKRNCIKYNTSVIDFRPRDDEVLEIHTKGAHGNITYLAHNIIVCTGGQASLPDSFPDHAKLHHSSEFMKLLPGIRQEGLKHGACVIGSGQSAAEIWTHLTREFPDKHIELKFRSSALKPSDDSPFVNQIFDPERVDKWYEMTPEARKSLIAESRATNYSVVRLHLLEEMYEHLYMQNLPNHEQVHHITPNTVIDSWSTTQDTITIHFHDALTLAAGQRTFDHVFCATGYQRNFHTTVLSKFDDILYPANTSDSKQPKVDRKYRVLRKDGDNKAGIYLQGLCESSHGLSDTLLSILAVRGAEVINDIVTRRGVDGSEATAANSPSTAAIVQDKLADKLDVLSFGEDSNSDSNYGSQKNSRSVSPVAAN